MVVKEIRTGLFLYRCELCGAEEPKMGVKKQHLGPPPAHSCPESRQPNVKEIMEGE